MALITRVARLFKSDFHAVLDQIEQPDQLLKQAIRDMEDELAVAEQQLHRATQNQEMLTKRKINLQDKLEEYNGQLDLCFSSGKDELARTIVGKKLETTRLLKHLTSRLEGNTALLREQGTRINDNRTTLEHMRQKAEVLAEDAPNKGGFEGDSSVWLARELKVNADEIEVAFLREQQQRSGS